MRLLFGAALVTAIYLHSPHRPATQLSDEMSRWAGSAKDGVASAMGASPPIQALADAALRHTLVEGASSLLSGLGQRPAAAPVPPRQVPDRPL